MRRYHLLIAVLTLAITACKKDMGKTNQPAESTQLRDLGTNPTLCYGNNWEYASTYPNMGLGLVHNNKIYVPDGASDRVFIYDGSNWTNKPSDVPYYFEGVHRNNRDLVAFTIGNKGYIFVPYNPDNSQVGVIGFWEYNFATNNWRRRADFPGIPRDYPAYFTIGNKGYVVAGSSSSDTWEYDPATNDWSQKASLGYAARSGAVGFNIGNKGYILGGRLQSLTPNYTKQLLEYNPATNNWTKRAAFPGEGRELISAFDIDGKAYAGGGENFSGDYNHFEDFYQYTPSTDSWITVAGLPGIFQMVPYYAFSMNSFGYCVTAYGGNNHIYKYIPQVCP